MSDTLYTHDGSFGEEAVGTRAQFKASLALVWPDWHRDAATADTLDAYIESSLDAHLVEADQDEIDRLTAAGMALDEVRCPTVNETGLAEIRAFLTEEHKRGGDYWTDSMLSAWASEAEEHMSAGNPPTIEIKAHESVRGEVMEFEVSEAGIDRA